MNEEVTYQWTKEFAVKMAKTVVEKKSGKLTHILFLSIAMLLIAIVIGSFGPDFHGVLLILFLGWIFTFSRYWGLRHHIKKQVEGAEKLLSDDKTQKISISEISICKINKSGTYTLNWDSISRYEEENEIIILYCGDVVSMCLPESTFSTDQLNFIKSKISDG